LSAVVCCSLPRSLRLSDERYLTNHHAIVTGGGRGIGAAVALELARLGASVTIMGRDQAKLDAHAEVVAKAHGVEVAAVQCEVSDAGSVAEAFRIARETLGLPYVLVNNAGQAEGAPFAETSLALWNRLLAVNLTGTFLCMQQVVPAMIEAKAGRIVNVASVSGLVASQRLSAYTASKHGVVGLTKVVALETAKHGVTVNAVCPGYVDTDMAKHAVRNLMKGGRTEEEARNMILRTIPRGTLITPQEVASAVAWLCSPGASGVTGEALTVAGGGAL
jgi:NAD(P)-dependent dehydrogenase (short-subunit alcohol dehydrogenase family)